MVDAMKESASVRAYRALLWLLPARVRLRHGDEMTETYAFLLERAGSARSRRWRVMLGAALDVLKRAPVEHGRRRYLPPERRESGMSNLFTELRNAVRGAIRQPGLTALVVLMLALGIAATTTVFTMINGLFLRPLPFKDPDQLVYVNTRAPKWELEFVGINYPDFMAWQKNAKLFESMAMYDNGNFNVAIGDSPERLPGMQVTYRYGEVLQLRPVLGRWFTAAEDAPKAPDVVVIGEDLWRTRFGASRDVLGKTVRIDSRPFTIVGVAPRAAAFPDAASVWIPYRGDPLQTWQSYSGHAVARLKPGATVEAARSDLMHAHEPMFKDHDDERTVSPRVDPLREHYVGELRTLGKVLGGGVLIVLLVACANVMSLMLARAAARRREMAVRMALGAAAGRLTLQLFAETIVLSAMGGAAGLLLSYWGTRALVRSIPDGIPPWLHFGLDRNILVFAAAVSAIAAVVAAMAPVLQSMRARPAATLTAEAGRRATATRAQRRTLSILVGGEIALACVLLVSGGLLLKAYQQLTHADPGFNPSHALAFRIALPEAKYLTTDEQRDCFAGNCKVSTPVGQFYGDVLEKLRALPDVESAGAVQCPPLSCHWGAFYEGEGSPPKAKDAADPVVLTRLATPGYDKAIGLTMLSGRFFNDTDGRTEGSRAAVVNEMLAKHLWPNESAVGKRLRHRSGDGKTLWATVVGVSKNVRHYGLDKDVRPALYFPFAQQQTASMVLIVRTRGEPTDIIPNARAIVRSMDADLPVFDVKTMERALAESLALRRMYSWMLTVFAAIALVLAVGGIYGVLSYVVGQRTQEIGIRMALGARRDQVLRLVLRHGVQLALAGTSIGLVAALATGRLLKGLLVGGSAHDAATFIGVAILLTATALLAAFVPARRAVSVEPQSVLRE